jgi:hypothetical protein
MEWCSHWHRPAKPDGQPESSHDANRRHELANELQAKLSELDEARIRLNQLETEALARFGIDLADCRPADPGDGGTSGHAHA